MRALALLLLAVPAVAAAQDGKRRVTVNSTSLDPIDILEDACLQALCDRDFVRAEQAASGVIPLLAVKPGDPKRYIRALGNRANLRAMFGRFAEAEAAGRETYRVAESVYGRDTYPAADAAFRLAVLLRERGRFREAEECLRHCWAVNRVDADDDRARRGKALTELAWLYLDAGRPDDATTAAADALACWGKEQMSPYDTFRATLLQIEVHHRAGRLDRVREMLDDQERWWGSEVGHRLATARYKVAVGAPAEAVTILTTLLDGPRGRANPVNPEAADEWTALLGEAKAAAGDAAGGRECFDRATTAAARQHGPDSPQVADLLERYAKLFPADAGDRPARAKAIRLATAGDAPRGYAAVFGAGK